jgi:rhodanese-related sulfurtransferase
METQKTVKEICPTTTQQLLKEGAILVDVRENEEVASLAFDVPKLIHIPLSEFENRFQELPKNQKLVLACRGGGRSLRAAGFLINHGYDPSLIVNMQYGIVRWVQKGFPVRGNATSVFNHTDSSNCCNNTTAATNNSNSCCNETNNTESSCC